MTFIVRHKALPGSPMLCDFECAECGSCDEYLVARNDVGDPPASTACVECGGVAALRIGAPKIRFWSRDPVALGRASKHDEKDPRALDTEPLATGKMTRAEWNKYQRGITHERRYQKKLKAGKISKRIQVDSKGVG